MQTQEQTKGCGRPINGNWDEPDWICGDYFSYGTMEDGKEYGKCYYCEECNKNAN